MLALSAGLAATAPHASAAQTTASPADAQAFAEFNQRVKNYIALQDKLEHTLPNLPKDATPQQIDTHQRSLLRLLQNARRDAKPGDVFVPSSRAAIRKVLESVYNGPKGRDLLASTMDENPVVVKVKVNDRYPDEIPLSTVPPQVLQQLPKLPEEMEYRFIGRDLILLDSRAHMVVDVVQKAINL
jgi:hypothetical protein